MTDPSHIENLPTLHNYSNGFQAISEGSMKRPETVSRERSDPPTCLHSELLHFYWFYKSGFYVTNTLLLLKRNLKPLPYFWAKRGPEVATFGSSLLDCAWGQERGGTGAAFLAMTPRQGGHKGGPCEPGLEERIAWVSTQPQISGVSTG